MIASDNQTESLDPIPFATLREACVRNGVDFYEFLTVEPLALAKQVTRSVNEIIRFAPVYRASIPSPLPILDQGDDHSISSGDTGIDTALGGIGIQRGLVTEISGESSSGKTCLAIQLALNARSAVYISTEGDQCVSRMHQMINDRFKHASLHSIKFQKVWASDAAVRRLLKLLPSEKDAFELLVVDSIADCRDPTFYEELRRIAVERDVAVVATNHVHAVTTLRQPQFQATTPLFETQARWFSGWHQDPFHDDNARLRPLLGYYWTSAIDQRIVLKLDPQRGRTRRVLSVVFSPYAPATDISLRLENGGLTSLTPDEL